TVTKTTSTAKIGNKPDGGTAIYTITVSNGAQAPTANGVQISDVLPSGFSYASTGNVALNGGATRPSTSNPAVGATTPIWGTFSIPANGSVAITFTAKIASTVPSGTYQNSANAISTTTGL